MVSQYLKLHPPPPPPKKRRFTFQVPSPIGESCSLVHILALLFVARMQDSKKKNHPNRREIQKLASQKGQYIVPKTTERCEINIAEFIECFTSHTRDPRLKSQHQKRNFKNDNKLLWIIQIKGCFSDLGRQLSW